MKQQLSSLSEQLSSEDWENTPNNVKRLVNSLLEKVALSESESCLIQFLEGTPIGISVHGVTGEVIYINNIGRSLLGTNRHSESETDRFSESFQIYRTGTRIPYPVEDLPYARALAGETNQVSDIDIHRPDRTITLEVTATPVFDDQGQVTFAVVTFQDISDRKRNEVARTQAESALKESELKLRNLTDAIPGAVYQLRLSTEDVFSIVFMSQGVRDLVGISPEQAISDIQVISALLVPEDLEPLHRSLVISAETLECWNLEFRIQTPSGKMKWILGQSLPSRQESGEIIWNGILTDISDRKCQEIANQQIEEALEESETRFRNIAANVPGAIFRYLLRPDNSDAILYMSSGCYALWEVEAEAVLADVSVLWQMIDPEDVPPLCASLIESAQNLQPWSLVWQITTPSGRKKWVEAVAGSPEQQENGNVIWDTLILDITDRKQAEAAFRESESRFQNIAANLPGAIFRYLLRPDNSDAILYVSSGCSALWEVESESVLADVSVLWQTIDPEDVPAIYASVMESAQTLQPWSGTWRITTPSGRKKWLEAVGSTPERQANGDVIWDTMVLDLTDRKQAEAAFRESESRFQTLADNVPGVIFGYCLRPDGSDQFTYISSEFLDLYGLSSDEALQDARVVWNVTHPDDLEMLRKSVMESAQTMQTWQSQYRIITPSGQIKWVQGISRPTQHQNGDLIWDGLIIDISDQKFAEEKFREQQTQLDLVVEASQIGFYISDFRTETFMASPAYKIQLGYAPDAIEASPADWIERLHPDDRERTLTAFKEFMDNKASYSEDFRARHRDGSYRWIHSNAQLIRDEAGTPIKMVGTRTDITDRKHAEIALAQSEQRFRNLFELTPNIAVQGYNRQRQVIYWNDASEALYGYTKTEAIGRKLEDLIIPPEMRQGVIAEVQNWFINGQSIPADELELMHKDGSRVAIYSSHIMLQNTEGEPEIYCVDIDLRDRKQAQLELHYQKELLQTIFDHLPLMIGLYSDDGEILMINRELERVIGWTKEEYKTVDVLKACYPNPEDYKLATNHIINADRTWNDSKCRVRDGRIIDTSWAQVGLSDGRIIGIGQDITDRKQAEIALKDSEGRYRLLAENINDLVCLHHPDGQYTYVSLSSETLLGYRYDEMIGQDPYTFFHPDDRDRIRQEAHEKVVACKPTPITYRMRQKSGNYIWFETLTKPIRDVTGQVIQLQTTSRDVTDRVQVQTQLKYDSLHDTLTGLANRELLTERLELAIHRAKRLENYHFSVLFLDLDRFKVINDSLGHLAGDKLLIAIAQKLQITFREIDLVARLGGDEFVILLEEVKDIQEAIHATERIFTELQIPITIEERDVYTNVSIGVVLGTKDYDRASDLLRDADIAMYRAKSSGKARYEIFDAEMHRQALKRMHLENDLRRAIDWQEFVLHYQPIVALDTGYLVGFEALIRWQHPSQGLRYPGEFITVAEELGLITSLSYWALRTACQQLVTWQTAFPDLPSLKMSVNLSSQDLRRSDLVEEVDRILTQTHLQANCLTLEITESMLIEDIESTIVMLTQLKEKGIQISIDDFGTGYSSLNYLHRLPMNNLKVDRSFVNQMEESKKNYRIVETIATLSQQLELDAIAEGIETLQQLEWLQQIGYKFGQGYLFSKPLSQDLVEELLGNTNLYLFS
jgi:diguanylate cyclase (GGDEF)-like protein/PAS domain S-box-containing protein